MLPLRGLRVLDLSRVLAGPWCTQLLGDLGARVLKVEALDGDPTRQWGPPFLAPGRELASTYFLSCNRNKLSVALDLKSPRGRAAALRLAAGADVLVENFLPGKADALGLGWDALRARNPRLIYASVSGYGQSGPRAHEPGYDVAVAALCGLMSVTGTPGAPAKTGSALTDIATGLYLHGAILAALLARAQTGAGARLDASLLATGIANLANVASAELHRDAAAPDAGRAWGTAHESIVPYQAFRDADGRFFVVAAMSDAQWRTLAALLGAADLAADARFARNAGRVAHRDELIARLAARFAAAPRAHWLALLGGALACAPVNSVREALSEPQVAAAGLVLRDVPHPSLGAGRTVALLAHPVRYSGDGVGQPGQAPRPPPLLGEHTREVLTRDAGYTQEEVEEMIAAGVARAL